MIKNKSNDTANQVKPSPAEGLSSKNTSWLKKSVSVVKSIFRKILAQSSGHHSGCSDCGGHH